MESNILRLGVRYKRPRSQSKFLRRFAAATTIVFTWSFILAAPAQALARQPAAPKRAGVRALTMREMQMIAGSQGPLIAQSGGYAGSPLPWEGIFMGVKTTSGNKLTPSRWSRGRRWAGCPWI